MNRKYVYLKLMAGGMVNQVKVIGILIYLMSMKSLEENPFHLLMVDLISQHGQKVIPLMAQGSDYSDYNTRPIMSPAGQSAGIFSC